MRFLIFYIFILLTIINSTAFAKTDSTQDIAAQEKGYYLWVKDFKKELREKHGIKSSVINKAFADVHYSLKVSNLNKNQPEFSLTPEEYISKTVSADKKSLGLKAFNKNKDLLNKIENTYKVPATLIVSFWGMESGYGTLHGKFNAVEALSNLSYTNKRRSEFFKKELISLIQAMNKNYIGETVTSSWAGAMGNPQFMPSNYLMYGVDYNKDGSIDIWNSKGDTFASMGNFINHLGWDYGVEWGREVKITKRIPKSMISEGRKNPVMLTKDEWAKRYKIRDLNGNLISGSTKVAIIKPSKKLHFAVTNNYYTIMKWNHSSLYAISVGLLSDYFNENLK